MSSTVTVYVVSPDTRSERRLDLHTTIGQLKNKLELITGVPVLNQALSIHNSEDSNAPVADLDDDSKSLGYYGIRDWQYIRVTDTNPATSFTGQLTDTSQVDKFELTEAEYAQRQDTVLAYKQRHKIGRFAEATGTEAPKEVPNVNIPIGSRCEVETSEEGFHKRGTVRFVGPTEFNKTGVWVGIEYDEPIGKNDGSVQGVKYFSCAQNFGVFVRPDRVKVGDYPVEEIDLEDEEM